MGLYEFQGLVIASSPSTTQYSRRVLIHLSDQSSTDVKLELVSTCMYTQQEHGHAFALGTSDEIASIIRNCISIYSRRVGFFENSMDECTVNPTNII